MKPLRIVIVGSGFRSLFFVRIIRALPERFTLCAMLCRTQEKADRMAAENGIPTSISEEECLAMKPDMAIVATSREGKAAVTAHWATDLGIPVLTETPLAETSEELAMLEGLIANGAKIQVAEQYFCQARHSARIRLIDEGLIGPVNSLYFSAAHDYHGASLMRRYLQTGDTPYTLVGSQTASPIEQTDSRQGPVTDGRLQDEERKMFVLRFADGRQAIYDFCGMQYRTFLRDHTVIARGKYGQVKDDVIRWVGPDHVPHQAALDIAWNENGGVDRITFEGRTLYEDPFPGSGLPEDETAIAVLMDGMRAYIAGGKEVYPNWEAAADSQFLIDGNRLLGV